MEWQKLLSRERLGHKGESASGDVRSEFQRDADRIVYSSAFRRLQDKTQVFPLAKSDYVRTRLTHSIEVSTVGRSLGTLVGGVVNELEGQRLAAPEEFGSLVAAACLAHDIGNPPFGHSGEKAIGEWFRRNLGDALSQFTAAEREDLCKFEGNAQGFRILTRLQQSHNLGGMQLTCATLAAFTKYPRSSCVVGWEKRKNISEKKFGFTSHDSQSFCDVASAVGLSQKLKGAWCRHPLAFLVEAADDICYHVIDLEDGHRVGRIEFEQTRELLLQIAKDSPRYSPNNGLFAGDFKGQIEYLRALVINQLIYAVLDVFKTNYIAIIQGTFERDLVSCTAYSEKLAKIKEVSKAKVYGAPDVIAIEAAGFEVLGGLLARFVPALLSETPSAAEAKLLELVPLQYKRATSCYEKLLSAADFVSGMTDTFALTMYRRLTGMELP